MRKFRKGISFLKARKFIDSSINNIFVHHVFEGDVDLTTSKASGSHHLYGVGLLQNNFGRIVDILSTRVGYATTHVEVKLGTTFYVKGYLIQHRINIFTLPQEYLDKIGLKLKH